MFFSPLFYLALSRFLQGEVGVQFLISFKRPKQDKFSRTSGSTICNVSSYKKRKCIITSCAQNQTTDLRCCHVVNNKWLSKRFIFIHPNKRLAHAKVWLTCSMHLKCSDMQKVLILLWRKCSVTNCFITSAPIYGFYFRSVFWKEIKEKHFHFHILLSQPFIL